MFFGKKFPTVYNAIASGYALIKRKKTAKKSEKKCFFSNFSKLERFLLRELSPIEAYNRNPVHGINIKRHPIRIDPQPAHLELVKPPRLALHVSQHPHHPRQPEHTLAVINIGGHPNTTLSPQAPGSPSYANLLTMFFGQ
jgi:hypothetical protein